MPWGRRRDTNWTARQAWTSLRSLRQVQTAVETAAPAQNTNESGDERREPTYVSVITTPVGGLRETAHRWDPTARRPDRICKPRDHNEFVTLESEEESDGTAWIGVERNAADGSSDRQGRTLTDQGEASRSTSHPSRSSQEGRGGRRDARETGAGRQEP